MLSRQDIIDLYLQYGFEEGPSHEQYLVFFSQSGYFQNAEIVLLDSACDTSVINQDEYEALGYAVRIRRFGSIEEVHESLFKGFFTTAVSNRKLTKEYEAFCAQRERKLGGNRYEYISGSFYENGNFQERNLIDRIIELFGADERQLIILEASAGYGKTCTSFEMIRTLVERMPTRIPLLAELSKNRKASVFRYVLLSEIDQKFPTLSSELVTNEIKNGRLFLLIDGFDELLSKSYSVQQDKEHGTGKDAQTMLDTIAQLIPEDSKTKILLTSRKSSIFVGEKFDDWVSRHSVECNITRLQLSQPSLRDWIGAEKIAALKANHIDLEKILNPVLLTHLKNEPLEGFREKYINNDVLIRQYLGLLLWRERDRQALPLEIDEQLAIMYELAAQMVQYDISAEDSEFIKELLRDIVEPKLEEYLKRYDMLPDSSETKPTEEEFLTKLSQHALLDRVSMQHNSIGFLNEFIFGLMISEAIIEGLLPPEELRGKYLDISVTAYASYSDARRRRLYDMIRPILPAEPAQRQIMAETQLVNSITGSYQGEYFDSVGFGPDMTLAEPLLFEGCTFMDCVFRQCEIHTDAFRNCQFCNCSFYDNVIVPGAELDCKLGFVACSGHEEFSAAADREAAPVAEAMVDYERRVLEQFWKPGYERAEPNRGYVALLKGVPTVDRGAMVEALEVLIKKNIVIKKNRVYELNFEKMDTIREMVGR